MAGERILIVDDSAEIIDFLQAILYPLGYVLSWSGDGKEGLTKAIYESPDLVLLDLNLPSMSGISILEALHNRHVQTPVVMMTFHGAESVVSRALQLGARGYLIKPFEVDEIIAVIERVLREERERREPDFFDDDDDTLAALQSEPEPVMDAAAFAAYVAVLSTATSQQEVLAKLTEVAMSIARADVSALFLRDGVALTLVVVRDGETLGTTAPVSDSHAEGVLRDGQPVYILSAATPPTFAAQLGVDAYSLLYVPVALRERVVGVLCVGYRDPSGAPTSETEIWLIALGSYVALSLENARLRGMLRKSLPVQKVHDVFNLLMRRAVKPLQSLWKAGELLGAHAENQAIGEMLSRQAQTIAAFLSIARDIATPDSGIFIGTATVSTIEKEIDVRLGALSKADN